jgi:hypothetical protein
MIIFKNNINKRYYFRFIFSEKYINYIKKNYFPIS